MSPGFSTKTVTSTLGKTILVDAGGKEVRQLHTPGQVAGGVVYVHYAPTAVCAHVEWALSTALGVPAGLVWREQIAAPGAQRSVVDWTGPAGTGARLANALRQWPMLRFEVTEDPSSGVNGERFSYVPGLGMWRGEIGANGDTILGESHLRALIDQSRGRREPSWLAHELDGALGVAWDEALEAYREGAYWDGMRGSGATKQAAQ